MNRSGPDSTPWSSARNPLRTHYGQMWSGAIERIKAGRIEVDPVLAAGELDRRRGLTVIVQPSSFVRRRVSTFLRGLRELEPEQYYYTASELHVTALSLFTASANHRDFFSKMGRYVAAVESALKQAAQFRIDFEGVTASSDAVMIQGFFTNDTLNDLRDILRRQLRAQGLGADLDQRYRLQTAHMTVVRFRAPLCNGERFGTALEQARRRSFGSATVRSLSLVEHDWYMSRRVTKVVECYPLAAE